MFEMTTAAETCEGAAAPHVLLERNGRRFSTLDLFGWQFVLLAGAEGSAWRTAALCAANQLGIQLMARCVGHGGDLIDPGECWARSYEVTSTGAVLVCPNATIGWRSRAAQAHPEQIIEQALRRLLELEQHGANHAVFR